MGVCGCWVGGRLKGEKTDKQNINFYNIMRKFLALAMVVFGLAACQNDPEELNVVVGGEQEVMLTVSLPEATRADSADGALDNDVLSSYDLRYILEVYYGDERNRFVKTSTSTSAVFPVRLAPGRTYTFVVWADFVEKGADPEADIDLFYETSAGLKEVAIIESKWAPMVEARDAYTNYKTVADFNSGSNLEMELYRPFAKVRVVSTDIESLRKVGIVPSKAEATYSQNMYRKFDATTGLASEPAAKTHAFAYADVDSYEANTDSKLTIFSDYIFVPAEGVAKFTLEVWDSETPARSIKQNNFNTDIFVEKNKITSIVGDVLTTGGNVKVTVDGELGEKDVITIVDNAQSLQDAINNAPDGEETTIELGGDIDLGGLVAGIQSVTRAGDAGYALLVDKNKVVVIDLKGFTISCAKTQTAAFSMIRNDGTLTIIDSSEVSTGKIAYADNGQGGEYVSNALINNGELIIKGGTIENNSVAAVAANGYPHCIDNNANLLIDGGTFSNNADYSSVRIWCTTDDNTSVTINDGTFNGCIDFHNVNSQANKGTLTINGGSFNGDTFTKKSVRLLGFGTDVDEMNGYIKGGYFTMPIALVKWSADEFNSQVFFISGGQFTNAAKENTDKSLLAEGYIFVDNGNETWGVEFNEVAKIGDEIYASLQTAFESVQDGETIVLLKDYVVEEAAYGENALNVARAVNFTLDLNGKTLSADTGNSVIRFNIGASDATSDVTFNLKNGTVVSGDNTWCTVMASGKSDTARAIFNLTDLTVKSSKGYDFGVKAWDNSLINAENVKIEATKQSGGFYALGGEIVLNNCNVEQQGLYSYPYTSMAFAVSDGGKMTINSGNYKAEPMAASEGNGQGTTHGSWCGGVMSSGGTLIINGGTFANGNFGDDSLATVARGCLVVDAGALLEVNGGTFNALKGIVDYCNNIGDAQKNPIVTIKGGEFSANPFDNVYVNAPDGYSAVQNGDYWIVKPEPDVAKIKDTYYKSLDKAIADAKSGDTIVLMDGTFEGHFDFTGKSDIIVEALNSGKAEFNGMVWVDTCTVTFKGIKFTNPNGVQHPNPQNSQYFNSINNQYPTVGAYNKAKVRFEKCTFDIVGPTVYGFYGYAHNDPSFVECVFNCNGIRPIASNGDSMTIIGCTFNNAYHYAARIFENDNELQTIVFTDNVMQGTNKKGEFEGVNISKKGGTATVLGNFTIKGNTATYDGNATTLRYRHHKNVTMSADCTYDSDIADFAFEREE